MNSLSDKSAPKKKTSRNREVKNIVRRGYATDDELFAANFGGVWPVSGLDKIIERPNQVTFGNFIFDITTLAYVDPNTPDRKIFLNKFLLSPAGRAFGVLATRFAYARAHDLIHIIQPGLLGPRLALILTVASIFSSYRYAMASSLVKLVAPSLADEVGQEHIHILQLKDADSTFGTAPFQASCIDHINNSGFLNRKRVEVAQAIDMVLTLMPRHYFGADPEIQARIHCVLGAAFPVWGVIPQSREELWAGLYDRGGKFPAERDIEAFLRQESSHVLRETFRKHNRDLNGHFHPPMAEINIGLNSLRDSEVLRKYILDLIPAAYGDLLVKYGDPDGRRKMGFSDENDILGLPVPLHPDHDTGTYPALAPPLR